MTGDKGLDSIEVWQKGMDIVKQIHNEILPVFSNPNTYDFSLKKQIYKSNIKPNNGAIL